MTFPQLELQIDNANKGPVDTMSEGESSEWKDRFNTVLGQISEGVLILTRDGDVKYANRAAEFLLGCEQNELEGEMFGVPCAPQGATEITVISRDARMRSVELRILNSVWRDKPAFLVTLQDVTTYSEQRHAAQLETKRLDEFIAVLSHEIRNPIGALQSAYHLIAADPGDTDNVDDALKIMNRQFRHLGRLLDDLLDLSRIMRGRLQLQLKAVGLQQLISECLNAAKPLMDTKQHTVTTEICAEDLIVEGDETRLHQVVMNLLTNACRYTDPGGEIHVRLLNDYSTGRIEVQDNGRGISEESLLKIFEPFVQGDTDFSREDAGLGIGLSLVKLLSEKHGGIVRAESLGPGHGSKFIVSLPLSEAERAMNESILQKMPQTFGSEDDAKPHVLLAEDNDDVSSMLKRLFTRNGFEVTVVRNGRAAVQHAQSNHIDLLLCDIGLPGLDGYQVAETLRAIPALAALPMIAVSGYARKEDKKKAYDSGFTIHFAKPFDFNELLDMAKALTR